MTQNLVQTRALIDLQLININNSSIAYYIYEALVYQTNEIKSEKNTISNVLLSKALCFENSFTFLFI